MGMNSTTFLDVLDRTKSLLESDAALAAFCNEKWAQRLTAAIEYRQRREIAFSELPLVLITRPLITNRKRVRNGREAVHNARLYAGFQNKDRVAGARELVEFEEKLEDALTKHTPFSDLALEAAVGDSVNDEGSQPPAFFLVMQIDFLYRRNT